MVYKNELNGVQLPALGFGAMRMPLLPSGQTKDLDQEAVNAMVDYAMAHGVNYFDTACPYHDGYSEIVIGKALAKYPRESFFLADKFPGHQIMESYDPKAVFEESLKKCGVEYFDYYLLHNVGTNVWARMKQHNVIGFAAEKKAERKIKKLGISFHDKPELFDEILSEYAGKIDFVQLQVNYADMETEGVQARECLEIAAKYNLPVTVMEPVKGGTLAKIPAEAEKLLRGMHPDATPASWALRFAASQKGVVRVLSGMNSMEQLEDNLKTFENFKPVTEEETKILFRAAEIINSQTAVKCTGCGYCTEGCPKGIAIPKIFALYNSISRLTGSFSSEHTYYTNLVLQTALASSCIKCGKCEQACPQHLKIRTLLEACVEKLENGNVILAPFLEKLKNNG